MAQYRSPLAVFALRSEGLLSDFETLAARPTTLGGVGVPVQLLCRLPSSAQQGDALQASITFAQQRDAQLLAHQPLHYKDIDSGMVALTLCAHSTMQDECEYEHAQLQLTLHGLHNTVKESAQYTVHIHPQAQLSSPQMMSCTSLRQRLGQYCQRLWRSTASVGKA
ncbi:hypothetical protein MHM93_16000 [Pseudoalteromonas sp. MM17-2]|uniref:hypothetical protein n=1 Tax=Pseudoalteromonas sp. MM17-2 TaxID=2917753 RepID=UPI001EF46128|nr:hypothetical protein [Pseudoalteromonas sp. MM17-2]MCG7545685.1 hypothetical protein [Pseudoalteromonas sp. MM17-2]